MLDSRRPGIEKIFKYESNACKWNMYDTSAVSQLSVSRLVFSLLKELSKAAAAENKSGY